MAKKGTKDTILSLYFDIVEEMKINDEFRKSPMSANALKDAKRELTMIKRAGKQEGWSRKDMVAFTRQTRNLIKMLEGKDYYFSVNDGFETYSIKKSTIESKGEDTSVYLLQRFRKNVNKAIKNAKKDKTLTKGQRDKKLEVLERLKSNISGNIDIAKRRAEYVYADKNMAIINDEPYPIFQTVNGLSIQINT